ncbi:NADPH-dependent ferric siderophore reductase [Breoghania corrubedonensis]|uniref:NADPH-dependent ferric siderophore reductase n=1 Tax=Breoghania corrubedonensis TaxID=665038 RepID=A0A2T5VBE4_9HYPH|nr:siderophore-interacting protein [Breoghania corrubedonensis]PTW61078.1 NADPH-dependent ferric siderophore reductase [Breoghania corrubedonensis]
MAQSAGTGQFAARARIEVSQPAVLLGRLADHFTEHGEVTRGERAARFAFHFGTAELAVDGRHLDISALASDASGIAFVKVALAEHIFELSEPERPEIHWTGDCAAGSPVPYLRRMKVERVELVTSRMRRVRLSGEDLERFSRKGMHIRLLFPPEPGGEYGWPVMGEDGRPAWPEGLPKPIARVYTIRRIDVEAGWLDVDMVLHEGDGFPGAGFAMSAKPGDEIGITGPGGGTYGQARRYLIAGDETALPAIARILEELPENATVTAVIEIPDAAEEQELASKADVELTWVHRNGVAAGSSDLLEQAVKAVDWPTNAPDSFVWVGCEHATFRKLRAYFRKEKQMPRENHMIVAYWRRGQAGEHAGGKED